MSEPKYLPLIHYLVGLAVTVELAGPDKQYVEILGSYESLEDAKRAVEAHAFIIADNDKQCLSIFKVDLNEGRVFDFYRKDLKSAVEVALKVQRQKDSDHLTAERENATKAPAKPEGAPHIFKGKKATKVGDFPRPDYSAQGTDSSTPSPLQPITIKRTPSRLK